MRELIAASDQPPRLPFDDATRGFPFALELTDGTMCFWEITPPADAERELGVEAYECGALNHLLGDPHAFFSESDRSVIEVQHRERGKGRAVQLTRGDPWWSILYASEGTSAYKETRVKNAFF